MNQLSVIVLVISLLLMGLSSVPSHAAPPGPLADWQNFKDDFVRYTSGPTGIYAIQDMRVLQTGQSVALSSPNRSSTVRWVVPTAPASNTVTIQYSRGQALISGPTINPTDLLKEKDGQRPLENGFIVGATQHKTGLKVWLYNPDLPKLKGFNGLSYFPFDSAGVVQGTFHRKLDPVAINYLDSRNQSGLMYWVGDVHTKIGGKQYVLRAFNYSADWNNLDHVLLFFRDRTSGKSTYGGGRVIEVHFKKGSPPKHMALNLNMLYSFLCAHSDFFNCPLNLTTFIDAELSFGEKFQISDH
jgi:uncharacterized protein